MTTDVENVGAVNAGNQEVMKGRQENEAANRQPNEVIQVIDGPGEDVVVSDAAVANQGNADPQDAPQPPPKPRWFNDQMRDDIVANFRRKRDAREKEQTEDADEIAAFMRSGGMPKEFQDTFVDDEPQDEPAVHAEQPVEEVQVQPQAPPPAPRKFKLKVNGKELELTEDELIARAQISEAADERLNEAKELVRELRAAKRESESRPSPTATPAVDSAAHEGTAASPTGDQHQVDLYKEMTEALLYGDPDLAAGKMRDLLAKEASRIALQTVVSDRARAELARSNANAARFSQENEELAKDDMAVAAIKQRVIRNQREDLLNLGIDPAKLQSDNDVMNMHLSMRANQPATVRTTEKLFEDAKDAFLKWRPGTPPAHTNGNGVNGNGASPQRTETPPIQVDVNRTQRRMAIQQQPSRTAVVKAAPQGAPPPKTRSQTIADMRRARGQLV